METADRNLDIQRRENLKPQKGKKNQGGRKVKKKYEK
jgi:hypothetical protein